MNVLYILIRNDLPSMNAGKAMAQSAHASNQFVYEKRINVDIYSKKVDNWMNEAVGFGTTITLSANYEEINEAVSYASNDDKPCNKVYDHTYPYEIPAEFVKLLQPTMHTTEPKYLGNGNFLCCRRELTCAYLFGDKDEMQKYIGHLKLHP